MLPHGPLHKAQAHLGQKTKYNQQNSKNNHGARGGWTEQQYIDSKAHASWERTATGEKRPGMDKSFLLGGKKNALKLDCSDGVHFWKTRMGATFCVNSIIWKPAASSEYKGNC